MATLRMGKDCRATTWIIDQQVSPTHYLLSVLNRDGLTSQFAGFEEVDGQWYFYRRNDCGQRPLTSKRIPVMSYRIEH